MPALTRRGTRDAVLLGMHRVTKILIVFLAACGGSVGPKYAGNVRVADSRLVAVNPDVKTLADANEPVFFARGSYWLFHDGQWFRAKQAAGPWTYEAKPPVPVRQIEQPYAYVHYKQGEPAKEIETVAHGYQQGNADATDDRPARDRQPSAVDPSVDPIQNL